MRLLAIVLLPLSLAACAVGPDYRRPDLGLTEHYLGNVPGDAGNNQWWRQFKDPVLDRIIERALAQNLDLAVAAARVAQARAAAHSAGAAMLPRLDTDAAATTVSQSLHSPIGEVSRRAGLPRGYDQYELGGEASWEVDLFGRLSSEGKAARADLAGTVVDQAAVRLSVVAETVDAYVTLRGLQARLAVAERQNGIERTLVDLIRQRFSQGIAAERDLNRSIGEQQSVEAGIAPLRAAIAGQIYRLDILTGQQAGSSGTELAVSADVPVALVPGGGEHPSDLMRRRPDIVAAERRLIAAHARIGAALAEYYPRLSFRGLLSVVSLGTSDLLSGDAVQASAGTGLRWRLFDFGRVDADVARARGREAEAIAIYRASVLRATADVETALVDLAEGRVELAMRERQVAVLMRAREQARIAYEHGAVALLDVLDADRAVLEASDRLEQARADTARASVRAVRALGGGYSEV